MFNVGKLLKSLFTIALFISFGYQPAISQDILFTDSFEVEFPGEWTVINNDGDVNEWELTDRDPHSGNYHVMVSYNANGNDDWLITPAIDLSSYDSGTFSFMAKSYDDYFMEDFNVKLSTSGTALADFTITLGEARQIDTTYYEFSYDLSDYAGQTVYLAIQCVSVDEYYLYVDDVEVTATSGGTTPTVSADFSADITTGTAPLTVNFSDLSTNATSWIWDFDNDGTIDATANSSPSFTYDIPGVYTVSLEVSDGSGNTDTEIKVDYITVTDPSTAISSTEAGGTWSETTTWVGGVVPTVDDDVIINGTVSVDGTKSANNVTVNADKILQNLDTSDYLNVTGTLTNNGMIRDNGYGFTIELEGDLINNGRIENYSIDFKGAADQSISMSSEAEFNGVTLTNTDTGKQLTAGSSLTFRGVRLRADDGGVPGAFVLPAESGFDLRLLDGSHTDYIELIGNGNQLWMSSGSYLDYETHLSDIVLRETVQIAGSNVYFTGDAVIVEDTLQNLDTSDYLNVTGTLTNNGMIRDNGYGFTIELEGDLINNGHIKNQKLTLLGTDNQHITLAEGFETSVSTHLDAVIGSGGYQWNFNDAAIAGETSKYLIFESLDMMESGSYYASTNEGNSRAISVVTAEPSLKADFTSNLVSGVAPLEITFTDASAGDVTSWSWDFGDGNTSEEQNPVHTYNTPGTYTVSLEVSDGTETDLITKTDFIQVNEGAVELILTEFKISPSDGASTDNFGYYKHVDIHGDYSIVGAYSADHAGESTGSAYIYYWDGNNWVEQARLNASDAEADDWFGQSVAIHGDYAVVGAPGESFGATTPGSAYVYERNGTSWTEVAILNSDDGENEDQFGGSVDIVDGVIVVGASSHDGNGYNNGAAYLFKQSGSSWLQFQKFVSDSDDLADSFGYSVALSGDNLLVANINTTNGGNVYYYKLEDDSYTFKSKLTPSDGSDGDSFGFRISLDGNNAAISSVGYNESKGKIYLFSKDAEDVWTEIDGLTIENTENTYFGHAIGLSGNFLIAGESNNVSVAYRGGLTYIYQFDGTDWALDRTFSNSDAASYDYFGSSVAVHNKRILVGAYGGENSEGISSGAAYIYMEADAPNVLIADFAADITTGAAPLTVTFSDSSSGDISGWVWDFGDGSSSDDQHPVHTFENAGLYTVSLSVTDGTDTVAVIKDNHISVYEPIAQQTWTILSLGLEDDLNDIAFADQFNGFIAGGSVYSGIFAKTTNGGDDWNIVYDGLPGSNSNKYPAAIVFKDKLQGMMAGYDGLLARTEDGGATWDFMNSGTSETLYEVDFFDAGAFAVGTNGTILKTTDEGEIWNDVSIETEMALSDIAFATSTKGFIIGQDMYGTILLTTIDGGENWTEVDLNMNEPSKIQFVNSTTGFILDGFLYQHYIHRTDDGGESWTRISLDMPDDTGFNDFYMLDEMRGYIVGNNSDYKAMMLATSDGGNHWSNVGGLENIESGLTAIDFVNDTLAYTVGWDGMVLRYGTVDSVVVSTDEIFEDIPEEFVLNQNYPNPFNPTTNIRFGLPEAAHVELNVYNLLGQKVLTLFNKTLQAGYHVQVLDGQQLSSGIYLYELKTGNIRLIEKMTLIK